MDNYKRNMERYKLKGVRNGIKDMELKIGDRKVRNK